MEHRWSMRKSLTAEVTVESPHLGRIPAVLRDVSLGGALVETGHISLPLNTPVSVSLNLCPGDHRGDYRLRAMVVRRDATGAGLLFQELDTETIRSLRTALYGERTPLASPSAAWNFSAA